MHVYMYLICYGYVTMEWRVAKKKKMIIGLSASITFEIVN